MLIRNDKKYDSSLTKLLSLTLEEYKKEARLDERLTKRSTIILHPKNEICCTKKCNSLNILHSKEETSLLKKKSSEEIKNCDATTFLNIYLLNKKLSFKKEKDMYKETLEHFHDAQKYAKILRFTKEMTKNLFLNVTFRTLINKCLFTLNALSVELRIPAVRQLHNSSSKSTQQTLQYNSSGLAAMPLTPTYNFQTAIFLTFPALASTPRYSPLIPNNSFDNALSS